jgi:transcriptional regulator with XRE-family HTH domain
VASDDFLLRRQAIAAVLGKLMGPIGFQKTLADRAGVDPTAVSEYLACKRTAGEPQLRKLAEGLAIPWSHFWKLIGDEQLRIAREEEERQAGADQISERTAGQETAEETAPSAPGALERALRAVMLDALREVLPPLLHQELVDHGLVRAPDSRKAVS